MIRGSDFVVYYVTDLDRAVAFYRDVLRLPLSIFKPEWNWAEFDASPTTLVLFGEYPGAPVKAGERGAVGIRWLWRTWRMRSGSYSSRA